MNTNKKIVFLVQGTGRGHLSQALALKDVIMNLDGFELSGCIIGTAEGKEIPQYFYDSIECDTYKIYSPQFATNSSKSISLSKTLFRNIIKVTTFKNSINEIDKIVNDISPDLVINFYEFLAGLWKFFKKNKVPMVSIAHQYLLDHKDFEFPDNNRFQQFTLKINNKLTSFGSKEKWALSFYKTYNMGIIKVIPPIIRDEVMYLKSTKEDFYLVYLCNRGYLCDIIDNARNYDNIKFEVFLECSERKWVSKNVVVNPLSNVNFLDKLSKCKGFITTSGFEAVCEATYLEKPCLLVPIENHYEQKCNAFDSQKVNSGLFKETYDLDSYFEYLKTYKPDKEFKTWLENSNDVLIYRIKELFK